MLSQSDQSVFHWLPQDERVRAQGIMWTFARWGGAFTPPLVVATFALVSWRWAFVIFGALGAIWAVFFYAWFRDNPRDHKSVNAAELALLEGSEELASGHGDVPWGKLIRSRSIWLLWAQYFCLSYPWYFFITWLPTLPEGPLPGDDRCASRESRDSAFIFRRYGRPVLRFRFGPRIQDARQRQPRPARDRMHWFLLRCRP